MTLKEFLALPEEEPALEYEEGVARQKVSPKGRHSALQAALVERINHFAKPRRLAYAFPELRATFAGRSYVPDVAVYRWERIPSRPDGTVADDILTPPDLAVEIASPEQRLAGLIRRCLWYVQHGVQIALLVDPDDESVLLFRPGVEAQAFHGEELIDLADLLPGCRFTARELFAALRIE
jgi:Uma2 family endonuclease